MDRLIEAIKEKRNPTVAGLDPRLGFIPDQIKAEAFNEYGETLKGAAEAVWTFNKGIIDAIADIVAAVKPQSAFYEALGFEGVRVLADTIAYAKGKGLYVIVDAKRGDIGSTAEAYADAYLGATAVGEKEITPFGADCLTVNGYLGSDGVKPLLKILQQFR